MPDGGAGQAALARVAAAVREATAGGGIPGAVLRVGVGDRVLLTEAAGVTDTIVGSPRPMSAATVFDLASLTKVVATLPVVLDLLATGRLTADATLGSVLPGSGAAAVTVRQLLSHTSGLPATLAHPLVDTAGPGRDELLERLLRACPDWPPDTRVRYSDVGYLLLGLLCERIHGAPLDEIFTAVVAAPIGLRHTGFRPLAGSRPATECPEAVAATEAVAGRPPKTGVVHDETAELLGGVAGHAGLFGDAADLSRYLSRWWLPAPGSSGPGEVDLLPAGLRSAALTSRTAGMGGHRGLGWALRGDPMDQLHGWPAGSGGHTGFTGTSVGFDPVSRVWCVLLTNAVHAGRGLPHIGKLRRAVHTGLVPLLGHEPWSGGH